MTNTKIPYPQWSVYRLSRLAEPRTGGLGLAYYSLPAGAAHGLRNESMCRDADRLASRGSAYFEIANDKSEKYWAVLRVKAEPTTSMRPVAAELEADALAKGRESASSDYEMLATVLMLGVVKGSYGSYYSGSEYMQMHLMACGIKWSRFLGVHMDSWSEWTGTFAEDERVNRLTAQVQCRCGEAWMTFGLEPPSIEQLFVNMSLDTIAKIYGV